MLRVDLYTARPGMKLALSVKHPRRYDKTLLRPGYALTRQDIRRLRQIGVWMVWVQYPGLEFLARIINKMVIDAQAPLVRQVAGVFEQVQRQSSADLPYKQYCQTLERLITELVQHQKAALFLEDLAGKDGIDLVRHSSTVTYIAILMGLRLDGYLVRQRRLMEPALAKEVMNLGLGAMLHDLGVAKLPDEVVKAYHETGDENDPAWQSHCTVGYDLVHDHIKPSATTVVLNHHQRYDGSGYTGPGKPILSGDNIHIFARIAGLADQFDELRHPHGQQPLPTVAVLAKLLSDEQFKRHDPRVMRALLSVVPPYPPGSIVRLSDERWAVSLEHAPFDPCRPTVQIIPSPDKLDTGDGAPLGEMIELCQHNHSLFIAESDGHDVSGFNFPSLSALREMSESMATL